MDRLKKTERLIKVWFLLANNPFHFTAGDLAEKCNVNVRTTYRDLTCLGSDLRVPVSQRGAKWGFEDGYFLPPVRFSTAEALTVFLAVRLMAGYSHRYDPYIDSAFVKLSSILPQPLKDQVQKTLDWMRKLPRNDRYLRALSNLADAWISRRRVRISYRSLPAEKATQRVIEPYFIEPAAAGHASYVIGYCHKASEVRTFKIDRIEGIEVTNESYQVPADFDGNEYLKDVLGVVVEGEVKTVRLRFAPDVARIMQETVWHPSQMVEKQPDGSAVVTLKVADTVDLYSFILRWGEKVEVLEPLEVRRAVMDTAQKMVNIYRQARMVT